MDDLYRIYMDDSGNVDAATTNAADVRYGSVTAVILKDEYITTRFNASFEMLSRKHFGEREDGQCHNIHRRAISSPKRRPPFDRLDDAAALSAWNVDCLSMIERAQFSVITVCVDKVAWYARYPRWDGDFYEVLVSAALERSFYFLKNRDGVGQFNIETKNQSADQRIRAAYRQALTTGFDFISAANLQRRFTSVEAKVLRKDDCRPGMQLADLVAAPAMQYVRHLETGRHPIGSPHTQAIADVLEAQKFYREAKGPSGYGRVWRPAT